MSTAFLCVFLPACYLHLHTHALLFENFPDSLSGRRVLLWKTDRKEDHSRGQGADTCGETGSGRNGGWGRTGDDPFIAVGEGQEGWGHLLEAGRGGRSVGTGHLASVP